MRKNKGKPRFRSSLLIIGIVVLVLSITALLVWLLYPRPSTLETSPHYLFSIYGKDKIRFGNPLGIAFSRRKIYVADSGRGEILVFDTTGRFIGWFPVAANGDTRVGSYPLSVAVDDRGMIYVSELRRQKLMVFDPAGKYLYDFPKENRGELLNPLAITFARKNLYVSDAGDQTVKVFNLEGKLLLKLGKSGSKKGEFLFPNGIAVAKDGTIFVSDSNNRRVQIFDMTGGFKSVLRGFVLPRGIALDDLERLHVADTFMRQIVVVDRNGKLLFKYGFKREPTEKESGFPNGIAFDPASKKLFITDRLNRRVDVWGY